MSLRNDIMALSERVAAVDPQAWEDAGDSVGYGVTWQGTLDMLAADFQSQNYDSWSYHSGLCRDIYNALPMGEQAKFDSAKITSPTVTPSVQTYEEALGQELSSVATAGAALGKAIVSPVTGAAGGILGTVTGPVLLLAVAAALVLFAWKS